MAEEIWKDIEGYEGLYQVSNLGRVKSLERKVCRANGIPMRVRERILKTYSCRGYVYVDICKNGIFKKCKIHRLVACAFLPNPNNLPQVNHINEVLSDNRVENLEWCTAEYNRNYGTAHERIKSTWRKYYARKIAMFDLVGHLIKTFECTKDVECDGFDRRAVDRVCKGLGHSHKGYKFAYL